MQGLGYFRYFEFFAPQVQYIELMLNETQRAPAGTELPIMCRQLIHRGLSLTDSIAAFLVAMGNYSYYSASTGWFDADWSWHTEYVLYNTFMRLRTLLVANSLVSEPCALWPGTSSSTACHWGKLPRPVLYTPDRSLAVTSQSTARVWGEATARAQSK
jgi:hypothetical protein